MQAQCAQNPLRSSPHPLQGQVLEPQLSEPCSTVYMAAQSHLKLLPVQIASSITAQGAWTPLWAAPEVFRHERATLKADIWSFGIILFELVSAPV